MDEYNSTENVNVSEIEKFTSQINKITKLPKLKVFCSTSPRSFRTAKAIFNNSDINPDNRFVEFDLRIFQIPLVKLKFKTWILISRILWFAGLLGRVRSFKLENKRAFNCVKCLIDTHKKYSNIVLVSHGLINMFIEKNLIRYGYKRKYKIRNGNFTIIKLCSLREEV